MEDGKWKMENEEIRRMGDWKMEDGKWKIENGRWKIGNWKMNDGKIVDRKTNDGNILKWEQLKMETWKIGKMPFTYYTYYAVLYLDFWKAGIV